MTSSDRWLSHYSFRLRNLTEDLPQEGLDGTFRRMAQALARYETPITFQVQLLDALSLTHVRVRQARTSPARTTTRVSSPTMTTSRPREGRVVIVGAGADVDEGRGPLWSPWGGVGPLAQLLQ
jgi:hypothetical protein